MNKFKEMIGNWEKMLKKEEKKEDQNTFFIKNDIKKILKVLFY